MRNSDRNVSVQHDEKILSWQDFPYQVSEWAESKPLSIASCLRRLLEKYEESEFIKYLVAPSPNTLSTFFHSEESDVYQALQELELQGYGTETSGDLSPIILWDPLIRRKTTRHHYDPLNWATTLRHAQT